MHKVPSSFNDEIRQILNKKGEQFKQFINNGKLKSDYDRLQCIRSDLIESMRSFIFVYPLNYLICLPQQKLNGRYLKPSLMVKKSR